MGLQLVNGGVAAVSDTTARDGDGVLEGQRLFLISSFEPAKLPDALVSRRGLLDALTRGVRERSMTLITAPAGSGKTVLAADWYARHPLPWPVAWLTVDRDNGLPATFWGHARRTARSRSPACCAWPIAASGAAFASYHEAARRWRSATASPPQQFGLKQLAEQGVIAVPLAAPVQRDHQQIPALHPFEDLSGSLCCRTASHSGADIRSKT